MAIIVTFVANTALNFVLALVIARFLGPSDYGRYAIAMSIGIVLNTVLLDWVKLSAVRYYSREVRGIDPAIRGSLSGAQLGASGLLALAALVVVVADIEIGISAALLAAALAAGIATAAFDFNGALARALFQDRTYGLLVAVKTVAGFVLMVGGAWWTGSPVVVIAAFCASVALAILVTAPALAEKGAGIRQARAPMLRSFLKYGVPLVAANAAYQMIPLLNRTMVASHHGFAEAGHFALAADMGIRVFASLGSALDIYLFQSAVRLEREQGSAAAQRRIALNITIVLGVLAPAAAGYALLLPAFEALLVPSEFSGTFSAYTLIFIPSLVAFAVVQYALSPVFQLAHATAPVMIAAAVGLAVDAVLIGLLPASLGPHAYAYAQLGAFGASLATCAVLATRRMSVRPRGLDLAGIAAATVAMSAAVYPLRDAFPPAVGLLVLPVLGMLIYGLAIYALDTGGLRGKLGAWRRARAQRLAAGT